MKNRDFVIDDALRHLSTDGSLPLLRFIIETLGRDDPRFVTAIEYGRGLLDKNLSVDDRLNLYGILMVEDETPERSKIW